MKKWNANYHRTGLDKERVSNNPLLSKSEILLYEFFMDAIDNGDGTCTVSKTKAAEIIEKACK